MNKSESAVQVLGQIEALIGASTGKSVVANIKRRIKEMVDNFNENVDEGDYDYFVDYCGMERNELHLYSDFDRDTVFSNFKDQQYDLYLDEVDSFIQELDSYERSRAHVKYQIRELENLLDVE